MNTSASSHRADLDAAKGILIAAIVLGHNYFFSEYFVFWFALLYNFHVASFLLLPFLFRFDRMNSSAYRARMFRTLAPQAIFLLATIPVYYVIFVVNRPEGGVSEWFGRLPLALLLQTESQLQIVTGFRHFWFLPAMAVLISLLWFVDNSRRWAVGGLVGMMILWHLSAGEINGAVFQYFPWSVAIVGFIFIPGLIVRHLYIWMGPRFQNIPAGVDILLLGTWLMLAWLVLRHRFFMPLAGDLYSLVSGLHQPGRLLFQDLFLVVSFLTVLRLGWWLRRTMVVAIGRESLKIFLLSPFVWQAFWMAGGKHIEVEGAFYEGLIVGISFALTLSVSYLLAFSISRTVLQKVLFPKKPAEWSGCLNKKTRQPGSKRPR